MTDTMNEAERIAAGGHAAVLSRLRPAFEHQVALHAGELTIDDAQLEALIADAAQRADGAVWRRALAEVACSELGIALPDAVEHPAVARAHELVGAPPWRAPQEVNGGSRGGALAEPETGTEGDGAPDAPDASDAQATEETRPGQRRRPSRRRPGGGAATGRRPGPTDGRTRTREPEPAPAPAQTGEATETLVPAEEPPADIVTEPRHGALRLAAVHLRGIETVRTGDRDIELRLSPAGLDVLRRSSGAAIGRLQWDEIQTIELPRRRGLRPGRRRAQEMHVATDRGQASFELPGLTEEQIKEHLEPMIARARGGGDAS